MLNQTTPAVEKAPSRFNALAIQIRADVTAKVQEQIATGAQSSMPNQYDQRIHQLEVGMTELQAHNKQIGAWFAETGTRLSARDHKLAALHGQLQQPQSDITAGRAEVPHLNKEPTVMSLGRGIFSFSETQISATQISCAKQFRLAYQQNRQATSDWAGGWSGVATISDYPSQEIQLPYVGERECGRALVTRHYLGSTSFLNAVIYGYPRGPTWPEANVDNSAVRAVRGSHQGDHPWCHRSSGHRWRLQRGPPRAGAL